MGVGVSDFGEGQAHTSIDGLDDVLGGGLERGRVFLLEGSPGTGKTTIATQFLIAGAAAGERGLYIILSENEDEFRAGAGSHGWDLAESRFSSWYRPRAFLMRSGNKVCSTRPISNLARPPSASLRPTSDQDPTASSSIACQKSDCSPRARCATAGRFSASSTTLPAKARPSSCWTI